jgi:hypothetical protein
MRDKLPWSWPVFIRAFWPEFVAAMCVFFLVASVFAFRGDVMTIDIASAVCGTLLFAMCAVLMAAASGEEAVRKWRENVSAKKSK